MHTDCLGIFLIREEQMNKYLIGGLIVNAGLGRIKCSILWLATAKKSSRRGWVG